MELRFQIEVHYFPISCLFLASSAYLCSKKTADMKPRIFLHAHYMEIGGIQRSLLGILSAIDTDKADVDLFINQHTGEFMSLIPAKINLLPEHKRYSKILRPILKVIRECHLDIAAARIVGRFEHLLYRHRSRSKHCDRPIDDGSRNHYTTKYSTPLLPSLKHLGRYDLAISFSTLHRIVKDKVDATTKVAWIHTDYTISRVNAEEELAIWDAYDIIVSISTDVTKAFTQIFPTLKNKIIEIENILSPTFIRRQAGLFSPKEMQGDFIKICSVGRFCYQKNFESIPFIAEILKARGLNFKWYIIGFGDETLIRQNIATTGTEDCVVILGKKGNPYPYIAAADIYAQPSRYEGKSVTVREAQILGVPVVITNYPTAPSQVKQGADGIICDLSNESIADAIYSLLDDKEQIDDIKQYLLTHDYGNEAEINKIYNLLDFKKNR